MSKNKLIIIDGGKKDINDLTEEEKRMLDDVAFLIKNFPEIKELMGHKIKEWQMNKREYIEKIIYRDHKGNSTEARNPLWEEHECLMKTSITYRNKVLADLWNAKRKRSS